MDSEKLVEAVRTRLIFYEPNRKERQIL